MMERIAPLPTPATQQTDYQGSRKNTEAKSKPQQDDGTARPVNLYIMRRGADVTQQLAVAREEVIISPERPVWHCLCVAMPICLCVWKQLYLQKDQARLALPLCGNASVCLALPLCL